jgi:histidyl-tRNA synthetase
VRYLCDDCRSRFKTNPLRLLDCKKKKCNEFVLEAPQIVDYLDEESSQHLVKLLEYLDEFDLSYVLNPRIVRGLDYYNKTAFEIWGKGESAEARTVALGGGGRYDGLLKLLGGRDTPALGFALGLERIIAQIREKNIAVPQEKGFDIFLAHIGEDARKKVLSIFENLRSKGFNITCNLSKSSLKQQLELADKEKVKITLILGEKEVSANEILIKEMAGGEQESVAIGKLEKELEKRLK